MANITLQKHFDFHVHVSDTETKANIWSISHRAHINDCQEIKTEGITWNEQQRFEKKRYICLIQFEVRWMAIGVQDL